MNYGLYLAASGMLVNEHRQDVWANNLANVNTTGFKPDFTTFRQRDPERVEDNLPLENPNRLLERLGGGVLLNPNRTRFGVEGSMSRTDNDLDLAIQGEGFFAFESGNGQGNERLRFSRDGRLALNSDGWLVHATSGLRVLDSSDRPIRIPGEDPVQIDPDGWISQNGGRLARLQVTTVQDVNALKKDGSNMYVLNADSGSGEARRAAGGHVNQGWLEGSAVNPMEALMQLNSSSGAVAANARMVSYHDEMMGMAINRFARVS